MHFILICGETEIPRESQCKHEENEEIPHREYGPGWETNNFFIFIKFISEQHYRRLAVLSSEKTICGKLSSKNIKTLRYYQINKS